MLFFLFFSLNYCFAAVVLIAMNKVEYIHIYIYIYIILVPKLVAMATIDIRSRLFSSDRFTLKTQP